MCAKKVRNNLLALFMASRYLFSKKRQHVINIISFISLCGVALATLALLCVLSVFNGFDDLVKKLFSNFDPDLKIEVVEGKCFSVAGAEFDQIKAMDQVVCFTEVLEDNCLLAYNGRQAPAVLKGVDSGFEQMSRVENLMYEGRFLLSREGYDYGVLGIGLASKLGVGVHFTDALQIFVPQRSSQINLMLPEKAFVQQHLLVAGIFSIKQPQYDDKYLLVSLRQARALFERDSTEVSAVELKVKQGTEKTVRKKIRKLLGEHYVVKDRYEQQEDFFQIMQIEKWITFLILAFILMIATFNVIGSLSMLMIDKKNDRETLRKIGASDQLIRNIFLLEGWLIAVSGALIGLAGGVLLCLSQQAFGWLRLGSGFITESYPVRVQWGDLLLILITVLVLGFLAAYYPVRFLTKNKNQHL